MFVVAFGVLLDVLPVTPLTIAVVQVYLVPATLEERLITAFCPLQIVAAAAFAVKTGEG